MLIKASKLPEIFPLLNRLHYLIRVQIVSELTERVGCFECRQLAETYLHLCEELVLGTSRPEPVARTDTSNRLLRLLGRTKDYDNDYYVSLPHLPQEVVSSLIVDRVDQYTVDELPKAIQILFQETKGKLDSGYTRRSIQVLYSTLGRLFSLIGRYEESEICHRNALGMKKPSEWRVGQSFAARMRDVENAASGKKIMRRKRRRVQLKEAESNLYTFSLVETLETQCKFDDAIEVLLKIRSITVGPNGLYIERETGGERFHTHRIIHARNLLIRFFIEQGNLEKVRDMGQRLDLQDALHSHPIWDSKVLDYFKVAQKLASAKLVQRQYQDASEIQRRLLQTSLEFFPNDNDRIRNIEAQLALSLSHHNEARAIEEAERLQLKIINELEGRNYEVHSILLNYSYTLAKLDKTDEALAMMSHVQAQQQCLKVDPGAPHQSVNSSGPIFSLYGSQEAQDPTLMQNVFLETSKKARNKDLFVSSMCLLFACSSRGSLLGKIDELVRQVTEWSTLHSTSIPIADSVILWEYVLYLLSSHDFVHEDLGELNRVITIAEGLDQDAVLCSGNPTDLVSSTRITPQKGHLPMSNPGLQV